MTKIITEETIFSGPTSFVILPLEFIGKLVGTTPSVKNVRVFTCVGSSVISNFLDGAEGQTIQILGNSASSIVNNSNIITSTGGVKLLATGLIYSFTYINSVWHEHVDVTSVAAGGSSTDLDRAEITFGPNAAQVSRTISVPGQVNHLDGTVYLTNLVDIQVIVTDASNDREPSATATLSLGTLGNMYAGLNTATGIYRADTNGRIDIKVTEPSAAYRYLWIVAGGHTRLFIKAKNAVHEVQFT